jgi:hypothetical protein
MKVSSSSPFPGPDLKNTTVQGLKHKGWNVAGGLGIDTIRPTCPEDNAGISPGRGSAIGVGDLSAGTPSTSP